MLSLSENGKKIDIGTLSTAAIAQSRLNLSPHPIARQIPLRTLRSKSADHSSLFAGMEFIAPDSPGRRLATLVPPDQQNREELLLTVDVNEFPANPQEQRKILDDLLQKGGDPICSGWALFELSQQLLAHDRPADAKRMLDYLIVRYPQHPYATPAYRWLITQQSSDEIHCIDGKPVPRDSDSRQRELRLALAYGRKLQEDKHVLAREPAMSILLASAARRLGQDLIARHYLDFVEESSLRWNPIAVAESERIKGVRQSSDKRVTACHRVSAPPTVDGQLNDACWNEKESLVLASGDRSVDPAFATTVKLQCDDKNLYVGAWCEASVEMLGDRLIVSLDIDRDYATFIEYSTDQVWCATPSGSRAMKVNGFVVKRQVSPKGWTLEMAIPLATLTSSRAELNKEAWGIDVRRTIPGVGVMTANQDGTTRVAQGEPCHFIEFKDDASSQPPPLRAN